MTAYSIKTRKDLIEKFLEVAHGEIGTVEIPVNSNSGTKVNLYQKAGRSTDGQPYCNSFICYCFQEACKKLAIPLSEIPIPLQAVANVTFNYAKKVGLNVFPKAEIGDLIVWKNPNSFSGHIGIIVAIIDNKTVQTIEANTSPEAKGNQRDGGGVYYKTRKLSAISKLLLLRGLVKWNF
jgi:hypothetical protein